MISGRVRNREDENGETRPLESSIDTSIDRGEIEEKEDQVLHNFLFAFAWVFFGAK